MCEDRRVVPICGVPWTPRCLATWFTTFSTSVIRLSTAATRMSSSPICDAKLSSLVSTWLNRPSSWLNRPSRKTSKNSFRSCRVTGLVAVSVTPWPPTEHPPRSPRSPCGAQASSWRLAPCRPRSHVGCPQPGPPGAEPRASLRFRPLRCARRARRTPPDQPAATGLAAPLAWCLPSAMLSLSPGAGASAVWGGPAVSVCAAGSDICACLFPARCSLFQHGWSCNSLLHRAFAVMHQMSNCDTTRSGAGRPLRRAVTGVAGAPARPVVRAGTWRWKTRWGQCVRGPRATAHLVGGCPIIEIMGCLPWPRNILRTDPDLG